MNNLKASNYFIDTLPPITFGYCQTYFGRDMMYDLDTALSFNTK